MIIESLHIISFGGINNRELDPTDGVNVIVGSNETGKSSTAMFIKFLFYGLSSKSERPGEPPERLKYVNRTTGQAAGYAIVCTDDGVKYRIERAILTSDNTKPRERVRIINMQSGETTTGQNPGELFFGVPADTFMNTCFISQSAELRPDSGHIGGALENLMTTGDENIDINKAIRALDNVRREISHKNGGGGELNELRERRAALEADIRNYSGRSAEIIKLNSSVREIKKRISELEADQSRCGELFNALDCIVVKRRIENAEKIADGISEIKETLDELDSAEGGDDISINEQIGDAERDIRAFDEAVEAYNESGGYTDAVPDEGNATGSASDYAKKLESSAHKQFSVSVALLVAGLIGLGISVLMYWFNTDTYLLPMIMTLAFVTLGVFFLIRYARVSSRLTHLLADWSVDSIDDLIAAEGASVEGDPSAPDIPEAVRERYDAAMEMIGSLCTEMNVPYNDDADIYDIIAALRDAAGTMRRDRDALTSRLSNLSGKLEILDEQLAGVNRAQVEADYAGIIDTPAGKRAAAMSSDDIKAAARERDFTDNALRSAEKRLGELELRLTELGAQNHAPDEAATAIDELDRRIDELTLRHDACELAKDALRRAGEKLRSDVMPNLTKKASLLIDGATGGAHDGITLDGSMTAGCRSSNDIIPAEYLSRGTADLAYIALRIAIAEEVIRGETPFMVFDESFAHIDAARISGITEMMIDGQYFIFTCHREEADAAAAVGANIISL